MGRESLPSGNQAESKLKSELTLEELLDTNRVADPNLVLDEDGEVTAGELPAVLDNTPSVIEATSRVAQSKPREFNPKDNLFQFVERDDLRLFLKHYVSDEELAAHYGLEMSAVVDLPWAEIDLSHLEDLNLEPDEPVQLSSFDSETNRFPLGLLRHRGNRLFIPIQVLKLVEETDSWLKVWKIRKWLRQGSRTRRGLEVREIHRMPNWKENTVNFVPQTPYVVWDGSPMEIRMVATDFKLKSKNAERKNPKNE